jgi:tryptophan synthase alpha subunit
MNDYLKKNFAELFNTHPEAVPHAIDIAVLGYRDAMTQATLEKFAYEENLAVEDVSVDDLYPEEFDVIVQATQKYYIQMINMVKNINVAPQNVASESNRLTSTFEEMSDEFPDLFGA